MNNEEYKKFYIEATKVLEVIEDSVAHLKLQEYPDNDTLFFH